MDTERPTSRIFLQRHIDALTAVLNDYEPNPLAWDENDELSLIEGIDILNNTLYVNFGGEVIAR